jgi:hypothetical protein
VEEFIVIEELKCHLPVVDEEMPRAASTLFPTVVEPTTLQAFHINLPVADGFRSQEMQIILSAGEGDQAVPMRRFWLVEGRDIAGEVIFHHAYPLHYFSDQQMTAALQALAAKSALSLSEILGALCRRGKRTTLLEVQRLSGPHFTLACGPSLEWTARVIPEGDPRLTDLV